MRRCALQVPLWCGCDIRVSVVIACAWIFGACVGLAFVAFCSLLPSSPLALRSRMPAFVRLIPAPPACLASCLRAVLLSVWGHGYFFRMYRVRLLGFHLDAVPPFTILTFQPFFRNFSAFLFAAGESDASSSHKYCFPLKRLVFANRIPVVTLLILFTSYPSSISADSAASSSSSSC